MGYPALVDPAWVTTGAMASARVNHTATVLPNGRVLLVGGQDQVGAILDSAELYDPATRTFAATGSLATARSEHVASTFTVSGTTKVLVGGGTPSTTTSEIYDPSAGTWSAAGAMNAGRRAATATPLPSGTVLVAGGRDKSDAEVNSVELYTPSTNSWALTGAMADARSEHSATVVSAGGVDRVFVVGGLKAGATLTTVEVYSVASGTWAKLADLPAPRHGQGAALLQDGRILIAGGMNNFLPLARTDLLNPATGVWTTAGDLAVARQELGMVRLSDGHVLVVGGKLPDGSATTSVENFDPATNAWTAAPALSASRSAHSASLLLDGSVLVAGGHQGTSVLASAEIYGGLRPTGDACSANADCVSGICTNGHCAEATSCTSNSNCPAGMQCIRGVCSSAGCTSAADCPAGSVCAAGQCLVPTIQIDATALTQKGLALAGQPMFDTSQVYSTTLATGSYRLQVADGVTSDVAFTVTAQGMVDYATELEGVLTGRGTSRLGVVGKAVTLDASGLSQSAIMLNVFKAPTTSTRPAPTLQLLPCKGYKVLVGPGLVADFSFDVDGAGLVQIPAQYASFASGGGTTTLKLAGVGVKVTLPPWVPAGASFGDSTLYGTAIPLAAGVEKVLTLLPVADASNYTLKAGDATVEFNVGADGNVTGDPAMLAMIGVDGTGQRLCLDVQVRNETNGWAIPPMNCKGAPETVDADPASPRHTLKALLNGPKMTPNRLTGGTRRAGGDPVLSDGEFFIQRTDADLAGYGIHYEFRRTYRSGIDTPSALGAGWQHNYDQRLFGDFVTDKKYGLTLAARCDHSVDWQDGANNLVHFSAVQSAIQDTYVVFHFISDARGHKLDLYPAHTRVIRPPDDGSGNGKPSYEKVPAQWQLTAPDGVVSTFDQLGYLISIKHPSGNSLSFEWANLGPTIPVQCTDRTDDPRNKCVCGKLEDKSCTDQTAKLASYNARRQQQKHLVRARDASRTIYYVYLPTSDDGLGGSLADVADDRLNCISLADGDCNRRESVLVSFVHGIFGLRGISHGPGAALAGADERYDYYYDANLQFPLADTCIPSPSIDAYCHRLCDAPTSDGSACRNLDWYRTIVNYCGHRSDRGIEDSDHCQRRYGLDPGCVEGCRYQRQCSEVRNSINYLIYSYGLAQELINNIVAVRDQRGQVVVQNLYGTDRTNPGFARVTQQTLTSTSSDNVIKFDYHDLAIEADPTKAVTYLPSPDLGYPVPDSGPPQPWPGPYVQDPYVQTYKKSPYRYLPASAGSANDRLCPSYCVEDAHSVDCLGYDYEPLPSDEAARDPSDDPISAVVIHDLHGLTRVQYIGSKQQLQREVLVNTGEATDYVYDSNNRVMGTLHPSGLRTCLARDDFGRIKQSALVAPQGRKGAERTRVTGFTYDGQGQLLAQVDDLIGPLRSRKGYKRDSRERITQQDEEVGAGVVRTTSYSYDGEATPAGVFLTIPTKITYPGGRTDSFSQFDGSMGGPRTTVIDPGNGGALERRYTTYDERGRVVEDGEVDRFATQTAYDPLTSLVRVKTRRLSASAPWIATTYDAHWTDGEAIVDSVVEPTRTTSLNIVGRFSSRKVLEGTADPQKVGLPARQATCYAYDPDGRLNDVMLPEGNQLHYSYSYGTSGTSVLQQRGYALPSSLNSALAACTDLNGSPKPPTGEPGPTAYYGKYLKPGGFIDSEIDEEGVKKKYETNAFGQVIQVTTQPVAGGGDPTLPIVQYGYDSRGQKVWAAKLAAGAGLPGRPYVKPALVDDRLLALTEFTYDLLGRETSQQQYNVGTSEVLSRTTTYSDKEGKVVVNDRGATTTTWVDGRGRVVAKLDANGNSTKTTYGVGVAQTTAQTNSQGVVTKTNKYDTRGLLESSSIGAHTTYTATYGDEGQLLSERFGAATDSGLKSYEYDAFGRKAWEDQEVLNLTHARTGFTYDRNDRLVARKDPGQANPWTFVLGGEDQLVGLVDPLGRAGTFSYPTGAVWSRSKPASVKEPNGRVTSYSYDGFWRLAETYEGECPADRQPWVCDGVHAVQQRRAYDARGRLTTVSAPGAVPAQATVSYAYDALDRETSESVAQGAETSEVDHTYQDLGRTIGTKVLTMGGSYATMTHRRDLGERLAGVDVNGAEVAKYGYGTGVGGLLTATYANGATTAYLYDDALRKNAMSVSFTAPGTSSPTAVTSFAEAFGSDSIPRMRQRKIGSGAAMTDLFEVDLAGRLIVEELRVADVAFPSGEISNSAVAAKVTGNQVSYTPDLSDNITQYLGRGTPGAVAYDALGKLTSVGGQAVASDSRDNLLGLQAGDKPQFTYNDFFGTLATATGESGGTTSFEYDALGRRRKERRADGTTKLYVWDGSTLVAHGSPSSLYLDVPGRDIDEHVVSIETLGAGAKWYYHQGPDQSVLAVTGSAGLVEGYSYSAYGESLIWDAVGRLQMSSAFDNLFRYQGQVYDALTGTYAMRARQYQPKWHRFLSADPLSYRAGPTQYAFTRSRPLQSRDPFGLMENKGDCDENEGCENGGGGLSGAIDTGGGGTSGGGINGSSDVGGVPEGPNFEIRATGYSAASGGFVFEVKRSVPDYAVTGGMTSTTPGVDCINCNTSATVYKQVIDRIVVPTWFPVAGVGLQSLDDFQSGRWAWGTFHALMAAGEGVALAELAGAAGGAFLRRIVGRVLPDASLISTASGEAGALATATKSGTTTLYRTVGEAERASIEAAGRYTAPVGGVEGKYFYPTAQQAESLARANFFSQGAQTLTSIEISNPIMQGATKIAPAGEGTALFFTTEQLGQLGVPRIWPLWPIGGP